MRFHVPVDEPPFLENAARDVQTDLTSLDRVLLMILNAILVLVILEAGIFALAAPLHFGVVLFGLRDSFGIAEGIAQGSIGLLMAICAYGIWNRATWSRPVALLVHGIGLTGALFGILVAISAGASLDLDYYNLARLTMLVAVPILLFAPAARKGLNHRDFG